MSDSFELANKYRKKYNRNGSSNLDFYPFGLSQVRKIHNKLQKNLLNR